jgi:putative ABC transport system substrate-binding protein
MTLLNRAASELGITLRLVDIKSADNVEAAFTKMKESQAEALIVVADGLTFTLGTQISSLALAVHLPSCHAFKEAATAGGLISLGPNLLAMTRPTAVQIDIITNTRHSNEAA